MDIQTILMIIVVAIFAIVVVWHTTDSFVKKPTEEQKEIVKKWLLVAVTEAEKIYGSKTGQIKLSYVYDLFIQRLPDIASIFTFDMFSSLVDEVLTQFRKIVESNAAVQEYIDKN